MSGDDPNAANDSGAGDQTPTHISKSDANKRAVAVGALGTGGGGVIAFFLFDKLKVADVLSQSMYGPGYALAILCIVAGIILFSAIFLLPDSTINSRKWFLGAIVGVFALLMIASAFPYFLNTMREPTVNFHVTFEPDLDSEANKTDVLLQPMVRGMEAKDVDLSHTIGIRDGGEITLKLKKLDVLIQHYLKDRTTLDDLKKSNQGLQTELTQSCTTPGGPAVCSAVKDHMDNTSQGVTSE